MVAVRLVGPNQDMGAGFTSAMLLLYSLARTLFTLAFNLVFSPM